MSFLERRFGLRAAGTSARTELVAGLVTFCSLSYILFVQPAVLSHPACGMPAGGVLFATCVASALACFLMAWWSNYPIALAPGMGHNFLFAFAICGGMGFRWQEALAANLLSGAIFLALARVGFRERVMHAIPDSLKLAISAGIGLLIALVGLEWAGIVVAHPSTYVTLGALGEPAPLLALFGLALTAILLVRQVPGAILFGVLGTAVAGYAASEALALERPLVRFTGLIGSPPSPVGTAFHLDFAGLFARPWTDWLAALAIFLLLDLFDTVGTLVGVADRAGLLVDGKLPNARGALAADAAGTVVGAALGTSTVTSYVESAAGVASGGRTGLTAVVVGLCFLAALVLTPAIEAIGAGVDVGTAGAPELRYPVIAPVLILVGALMMAAVRRIPWEDPLEGIPAFLTVAIMPLSFSITDGIAWGFIATSLLSLAAGRPRRVSVAVHVFAIVFVLRYVWLR